MWGSWAMGLWRVGVIVCKQSIHCPYFTRILIDQAAINFMYLNTRNARNRLTIALFKVGQGFGLLRFSIGLRFERITHFHYPIVDNPPRTHNI